MHRDRRRAFSRASSDAMGPVAGAPGGDADAAMSTGPRVGRRRPPQMCAPPAGVLRPARHRIDRRGGGPAIHHKHPSIAAVLARSRGIAPKGQEGTPPMRRLRCRIGAAGQHSRFGDQLHPLASRGKCSCNDRRRKACGGHVTLPRSPVSWYPLFKLEHGPQRPADPRAPACRRAS